MKMLFNVTGQNIVGMNIDGVCNLFSCYLCTKVSRFKTLFLLTLFGRGQLGLGAHSTSRGIAALCDITKGMFFQGVGVTIDCRKSQSLLPDPARHPG